MTHRRNVVAAVGFSLLAALLVSVAAGLIILLSKPAKGDVPASRVRYPGEEAAAVKACKAQGQKVMYWWLSDPRKSSVTLHARCTGMVNVDAEVKL